MAAWEWVNKLEPLSSFVLDRLPQYFRGKVSFYNQCMSNCCITTPQHVQLLYCNPTKCPSRWCLGLSVDIKCIYGQGRSRWYGWSGFNLTTLADHPAYAWWSIAIRRWLRIAWSCHFLVFSSSQELWVSQVNFGRSKPIATVLRAEPVV